MFGTIFCSAFSGIVLLPVSKCTRSKSVTFDQVNLHYSTYFSGFYNILMFSLYGRPRYPRKTVTSRWKTSTGSRDLSNSQICIAKYIIGRKKMVN